MNLYYTDDLVTLHHGDALAVSRELETGSVQTIVTSPPYFGLRDYGVDGQAGAESTVTGYVDGMVALFHELRRVLADDGTLWLNLGDSYSVGNGTRHNTNVPNRNRDGSRDTPVGMTERADGTGLPRKNLVGIPWRVAFALQSDGWILRSDIIWAKPNPMPESTTDRPTKAHEYLFLLAKSTRYYYDAEAVREVYDGDRDASRRARNGNTNKENSIARPYDPSAPRKGPRFGGLKYGDDDSVESRTKSGNVYEDQGSRNKRSVWTVATQPFPGSHFAVYPPELIRPCIRAGSRPGDTVLDPFSGSGTTGMVATQEGRKYIGIDLNADYLRLSLETRFVQPVLNLEALA